MCIHYRIQNARKTQAFARQLADEVMCEDFEGGDAWPRGELPVLARSRGKKILGKMGWGIYPRFGDSKTAPIVNAREDALLVKPTWRDLVQTHRCLIPADGFFEWAGPKGSRHEVLFHLVDNRPFFFAGLWSKNPDGNSGYVIVTGAPNELLKALPHDRMPVILEAGNAEEWLSEGQVNAGDIQRLCIPYPGSKMIQAT